MPNPKVKCGDIIQFKYSKNIYWVTGAHSRGFDSVMLKNGRVKYFDSPNTFKIIGKTTVKDIVRLSMGDVYV